MTLSEPQLAAIAVALRAETVSGWSPAECKLARRLDPVAPAVTDVFRQQIRAGFDPLGEAFCDIRSSRFRRALGATYTPEPIVRTMIEQAAERSAPARVVDPGTGSGRFLVAAGRRFRSARLLGVEIDPLAALLARANLAAAGLADRARIVVRDFRNLKLEPGGKTLFVGNPPYVRHHRIDARWKRWLSDLANDCGIRASQLAGLHVHFFLKTAMLARDGDGGAFITASEWLDVNYGELVRRLFLGRLGGRMLTVIDPVAMPFSDAAATAAIAYFKSGRRPRRIAIQRVATLEDFRKPIARQFVPRERLEAQHRWSQLTRTAPRTPAGFVQLGELFRVHRGQVTGANRVWIAGEHAAGLPRDVLYPSVTRGRELFDADGTLRDASKLRRVIDLPADLDRLDPSQRRQVEGFLRTARAMGAPDSYVARHRRAWWRVGLRAAAPILATYMARRPPAFVRNLAAARHINIAHGLYPRQPWDDRVVDEIVAYLSANVATAQGRTYAGGLTKFEPREMERLIVPRPEILAGGPPESTPK